MTQASLLAFPLALTMREVRRYTRQPARIVATLATPLMLWGVAGAGLGRSFTSTAATGDYLAYLFPGMLVMTVMFSSIFAAFSTIEDRNEGILQAALVSPVPRWSIALGKTLGGTVLAFLQGALLLPLAWSAGLTPDVAGLVEACGWILAIAFALSALGFATAWISESTQSYHSTMSIVLMPLWGLSGSAFPTDGSYAAIAIAQQINPLTYAVNGLRHALGGIGETGTVSFALNAGVSIAFCAGMLSLACMVSGRVRQSA